MSRLSRRLAIVVWIVVLAAAVTVIARARFTADLSAFLPTRPTPEQAVLIDQLREGPASHLILIAIEGSPGAPVDDATLAALSIDMASRLRADRHFLSINNGRSANSDADRKLFFAHRYVLSDQVTAVRFTAAGLHAALTDSLDLLTSSAGLMLQPLITRDPTAELVHLVEGLAAGRDLPTANGVWVTQDAVGRHALLIAETSAAGSDIDGQEAAVDALRAAFAAARAPGRQAVNAKLSLSGLPVFAVDARATIEREAAVLSTTGLVLVSLLLGFVYRSIGALFLGLVPMVTGALFGLAVVALDFGVVHGITLGFGVTLIGEAVDYAIYLFVQRPDRGGVVATTAARFWQTIALGVATSVIGFGALMFSGFDGLAQIGMLSICGLAAAAAVTRWVLPSLMPAGFAVRPMPVLGERLRRLCERLPRAKIPVLVIATAGVVVVGIHRDALWSRELSSLSSFSQAQQDLDQRLRGELGAPDVRDLVVIDAASQEDALRASEAVTDALAPFIARGALAGVEAPSRYLPSEATQRARQAALPGDATLRKDFASALQDLPFNKTGFDGFFEDVAREKAGPLVTRGDLEGSSLGPALRALLGRRTQDDGSMHWNAVVALRSPPAAETGATADVPRAQIAAAIERATNGAKTTTVRLVDIKNETQKLYAGYLGEALRMAGLGALAIVLLLAIVLRDAARLARVMMPLLIAVIVVTAGHVVGGHQLNLFHLVGLLLIVGVGSNYALFFDRRALDGEGDGTDGSDESAPDDARLLTSLVVANLTAVIGFGVLAFSSLGVLNAIGTTVAPGAFLALWLSAVFSTPPRRHAR